MVVAVGFAVVEAVLPPADSALGSVATTIGAAAGEAADFRSVAIACGRDRSPVGVLVEALVPVPGFERMQSITRRNGLYAG